MHRYRQNYFSDAHGKVLGYTIIVAEDYTKVTEDVTILPSWREAQKHSTWPPYQVMHPTNPFNKSAVDDFTVGTDEDCLKRHGYCNGPLRPGTLYRFKVKFALLATQTIRNFACREIPRCPTTIFLELNCESVQLQHELRPPAIVFLQPAKLGQTQSLQ